MFAKISQNFKELPDRCIDYLKKLSLFDKLAIVASLIIGVIIFIICRSNYHISAMTITLLTAIAVVLRFLLKRAKKSTLPVTIILIFFTIISFLSEMWPQLSDFIVRKRVASYHYFMGAKYFRELEYFGLYKFTALANKELGYLKFNHQQVPLIRDLQDMKRKNTDYMVENAASEKHLYFSEKRWEEFKNDYAQLAGDNVYWDRILNDHGFNPSPFWNFVPGIVAQLFKTDQKTSYMLIRLFDILTFFIVLGFVVFVIGLDWALIIFIFVTSGVVWYYPDSFVDTFFQFMWFNALILTMIFFRKGMMKSAGIALAFSTMIRIFPLMFAAGMFVIWLVKFIKDKKIPIKETQFVMAFIICIIVFGLIGLTQGKGPSTTKQFLSDITHHADFIKFHRNKFGLKRLMCINFADFSKVEYDQSVREINFHMNAVYYYISLFLLFGLNLAVMAFNIEKDEWLIPLGMSFIFALMTSSRYYYLMFVVFFLPSKNNDKALFPALVTAMIFLSHYFMFYYPVRNYVGFSVGNVGFFLVFLLLPLFLVIKFLIEKGYFSFLNKFANKYLDKLA